MSNTATAQAETQTALAAALAARHLPTDVRDRAERLHAQLDTPTRISLLGLPRIGKTGVLNLLAGAPVVPEGCDLGTVQVVHGPTEQTTLTLPDGDTATLDGLPSADKVAGLYPVLTRIEAPLPALTRISLLELGQTPDHEGQRRAVKWAIKQTDVMIWCTETFGPVENGLWQLMPDRLRDHSILLRTRTDEVGRRHEDICTALRDHVGNDFAYVLAVSTLRAREAGAAGSVDKDKMRASGGTKLISTLLHEIEAGRQYVVDQADILLRQHPAPEPTASSPDPEPINEPVVQDVVEQTHAPEQPAPEPAADDTTQDTQAEPDNIVAFDAFRTIIDRLQDVGRTLAADETVGPRAILDASAETLNWLGEHLEDADLPDTSVVERLRDMTQDADDLVQLMRIEHDDNVDTDAVLILLQLKRGFQAALAA